MDSLQFGLLVVQVVVTAAVAVLVPVVTFRFSKRLKEMEVRSRDRDREFELTKTVSTKAVDALAQSYYQLQRINFTTQVYSSSNAGRKKEMLKEFMEATSSLEKNQFYLPDNIRDSVFVLVHLSLKAMRSGSQDDSALEKAFDEVMQMSEGIKDAFVPFMRRYNLLNREHSDN